MGKKKCDSGGGAPGWMVTFGDLMSLLLTFFILLLSFAEMDVQKFKEMAGQIKVAFGVQRRTPVKDIPKGMDIISRDFNPRFTQEELLKRIRETLKTPRKGKVEILKDMRGIVLRLKQGMFFDRGGVTLRPNAWPVLDTVVKIAGDVPNDVRIEVHTGKSEFKESELEDNWQLSAERSVRIVRYLRKFGTVAGRRLHPVARGSSVPLIDPEMADPGENSRVEVVFLKDVNTEEQVMNRMFSPTGRDIKDMRGLKMIDVFKLGR